MSKKVKNIQPEVDEVEKETVTEETTEAEVVEIPEVKAPFWKRIPWKKVGKVAAVVGAIGAAAAVGLTVGRHSDSSEDLTDEDYIEKLHDCLTDGSEGISIDLEDAVAETEKIMSE